MDNNNNIYTKFLSILFSVLLIMGATPLPSMALVSQAQNPQQSMIRDYIPSPIEPGLRQALQPVETLTNPFEFFTSYSMDSRGYGQTQLNRVFTEHDWENRRDEIIDLMHLYYTGFIWPIEIDNITVNTNQIVRYGASNTVHITIDAYNSETELRQVSGTIASGFWLPTVEALIENGYYETGGPVVISMGPLIEHEIRNEFLSRGIAVAVVPGPNNVRAPDELYNMLFPYDPASIFYNSSVLGIHSWNVSRFLDVLEIKQDQWRINPSLAVTIGHSGYEKNALITGILDERVAVILPNLFGGDTGLAPIRSSHAGAITPANTQPQTWHNIPRNQQRNLLLGGDINEVLWGNVDHLISSYLAPFDTHLFASLQAGRIPGFDAGRVLATFHYEYDDGTYGSSLIPTVKSAANEVFKFLGYNNHLLYLQPQSITQTINYIHHYFQNVIFGEDVVNFGTPVNNLQIDSKLIPWARPTSHYLTISTNNIALYQHSEIIISTDAPYIKIIDYNNIKIIEVEGDSITINSQNFDVLAESILVATYGGDLENITRTINVKPLKNFITNRTRTENIGDAHALIGFGGRIMSSVEIHATNESGRSFALQSHTSPNVSNTWTTPFGVRVPLLSHFGTIYYYTLTNLQFYQLPDFTFLMNFRESLMQEQFWDEEIDEDDYIENGTDLMPVIHHLGQGDFDEHANRWNSLSSWTIAFSEPVNPLDFGIGFNFSTSFRLNWNEDYTILTVEFDNFISTTDEFSVIINRLRTGEANLLYSGIIQHSFPGIIYNY